MISMKPYKIEIYVYAENEEQAKAAQTALVNLVRDKYNQGILVTAEKLISALARFKDSIIVNQFLK